MMASRQGLVDRRSTSPRRLAIVVSSEGLQTRLQKLSNRALTTLRNSKSRTIPELNSVVLHTIGNLVFADSGDTIEPGVSTVLPPLLSLGSMSPLYKA